MEATESNELINEPKMRLNIKQNFKGEKAFDLTVRGEDIKEIEERLALLRAVAEKEVTR